MRDQQPWKQPVVDAKASAGMREVRRLRLMFLVPMALAILVIVAAVTALLHQHEREDLTHGLLSMRVSAHDLYESSIRYETSALQSVMDVLEHDHTLQTALAHQDRQRLLMHGTPLFERLKRDLTLTHLYFSTPDRRVLLRVHQPARQGDRLDRYTTLTAEKSGTRSAGVELGPLGTFTLRLVAPWYDGVTHRLIGYVEVGMELDRVLQQVHDYFGAEVFVLAHKDRLDRAAWEAGMRALDRSPDWEQYPTVVLAGDQQPRAVSHVLAERLAQGALPATNSFSLIRQGAAAYQLAMLPLRDAAGEAVAHMALLADVSMQVGAADQTVYRTSLATAGVGLALLGFFFWLLGRIGRRIESDARALEHLATHDGLTGLYNHRSFYQLLEEEIARARRYGHSFGLLMIDIDHFKHVNDSYGHQAGDAVLHGLSLRLSEQVRAIDRVCRYGGEEIVVLLPEMNRSAADSTAERLRAAVEDAPFDWTPQPIHITVSIGVVVYPQDADSAETLVSFADAAMYTAKRDGRNRVCHHTG